jgi:hypothetical protein
MFLLLLATGQSFRFVSPFNAGFIPPTLPKLTETISKRIILWRFKGKTIFELRKHFMRLLTGKAGKFESAVGVLYLFHLVVVVGGLLVIQARFDMSRFGIASEKEHQGGFLPAGKAETYDTDNLYEKIDGKAPMYQETGFMKLTTQRFAGEANSVPGFEQYVYDMGNTRNAFSVYSRQKRDDVVELTDMPFGYKTSNAIYISHGKYYIEMVGFAESEELIGVMKDMVLKLTAQWPLSEKDKIEELNFFPDGIVAGSEKLQIRDAYGFDGLTDTYSARYKQGDKEVTIFFSKRSNSGEAQKVAKSYNDFMISNNAKPDMPNSEILKSAGASVLDFYGSTEIIFATGSFVGGVHEANDRQAAEEAAEALLKRLNKI